MPALSECPARWPTGICFHLMKRARDEKAEQESSFSISFKGRAFNRAKTVIQDIISGAFYGLGSWQIRETKPQEDTEAATPGARKRIKSSGGAYSPRFVSIDTFHPSSLMGADRRKDFSGWLH